jgi:very-short-patch-repair endonuclease
MKSKATLIPAAFWIGVGLPAPAIELKFHPTRRWRFDFAFPDKKIAVEIEGGAFTRGRHTRGKGFISDMQKYNAATVLGWKLLRYTPQAVNFNEIRELYNG